MSLPRRSPNTAEMCRNTTTAPRPKRSAEYRSTQSLTKSRGCPSGKSYNRTLVRGRAVAVGIASMTGFARAEGDELGISWAWEVKSVNGKSLDLRLRLAPGFDSLEPQLRALMAQRFRRGNFSA